MRKKRKRGWAGAVFLTALVSVSLAFADPLPAHDLVPRTPNEDSEVLCDHDFCFWQMTEGEMDEDVVWEVLMQPLTVLQGGQRDQVRVRARPEKGCDEYTGVVTCASQGVHVLRQEGDWTLIEAYSSAEEGSRIQVWAERFQGYVETKLLKELPVNDQYGIVIDKLQQRLYVYKEGHLFSTLLCSTGFPRENTPFHETPAGEYAIVSWVGDFWSDGGLFCAKGLRINKGIMLHEVPCVITTDDSGNEKRDYSRCERYLGEKASHGCIRIQKEKTPQGVNAEWLWNNLSRKPVTKVIIWDELGRSLGYPDEDYPLYYNPKGGKNYHSDPNCLLVREKYRPLTEFTWGELEEKPYSGLTPCPGCAPQLRREGIDTVNEKNTR
ncbi:MAG: L,D-transpeptidase [Clostridia bacterium]|nr:L,D-transpeptidase [Clostridia bacterium]